MTYESVRFRDFVQQQEVPMTGKRLSARIKTVGAAALLTGFTLDAAVAACQSGYFCTGVIETMTITDDSVFIRLVGGTAGLTNCTPYAQSYFSLPKSNVNYASYYSVLLAAYMAKESVTLRPVDSSTNCTISYVAVP
jgi:hypothetical protein